ncbi:hypothetical protein EDC01DRAFT_782161 [Geopyxis carbonaria]|nr:hypothetical protein EDC01DRAFT_782161 [Geopyxis carbonaria]
MHMQSAHLISTAPAAGGLRAGRAVIKARFAALANRACAVSALRLPYSTGLTQPRPYQPRLRYAALSPIPRDPPRWPRAVSAPYYFCTQDPPATSTSYFLTTSSIRAMGARVKIAVTACAGGFVCRLRDPERRGWRGWK